MSEVIKYQRGQDQEAVDKFNRDVQDWAKEVQGKLRSNVRAMVKKDNKLSSSIRPNFYKDKTTKEINRIGFSFRREGIYLHYGAGKGQGGFQGSKWTDSYGTLQKTNPDSYGKMGTGARHSVDWFNTIIKKEIETLADIVAEYSADLIVDATRIYIPD